MDNSCFPFQSGSRCACKQALLQFSATLLLLIAAFHTVGAATVDLHEFLPYKRTDNIGNSTLNSTTGTGHQFRFYSPTHDFGFDWDFRKKAGQTLAPFRRQTLRRDTSGLSVTVNTFYDYPSFALPVHASSFNPSLVIAPQLVDEGQVILSTADYLAVGFGNDWSGTATSKVTIGNLVNRHTPAGKTDVLPVTLEYLWSDTGADGWGTGVVSQTWYLTRELGAFQVSYSSLHTNMIGDVLSDSDEFHLQTSTLSTNTTVVSFVDPNLEAAVRARLFKPTGDVTAWDMAFLLDLNAPDAGITDLTGLEYAYRLASLRLASNNISDISVLADLPKLAILDLAHNSVSDVQPLLNLTNMFNLTLTRNTITTLDGLQQMTRLRTLYADENVISDISALAGLADLQTAILGANAIVDVSPLAGLPLLVHLEIEMNQVHDLTPLAAVTTLIQASVEENCLDVSPGADDRLVIDGWIAGGTSIEPEWPTQYDCAPTIITIGLTIAGDVPTLQWVSESGASYRIESNPDLNDPNGWTDAEPNPIAGTGGVVQWTGSVTTAPQLFYRVRLEAAP